MTLVSGWAEASVCAKPTTLILCPHTLLGRTHLQGESLVLAPARHQLVTLPVLLLGFWSPSELPIKAEPWQETAFKGEGFPSRIKVQD